MGLIFLTPGTNQFVFSTNCSVRLDLRSLNQQHKDPMRQKGSGAPVPTTSATVGQGTGK